MEPPGNEAEHLEWPGDRSTHGGESSKSHIDLSAGSGNVSDAVSTKSSQDEDRKPVCRYGRGCSHTNSFHRARYAHPPDVVDTRSSQLRTGHKSGSGNLEIKGSGASSSGGGGEFVCNECGMDFTSVHDLQLHMVRKTAWSNQGLVGCRVSCLVDNREWHEGLVTHFHKSGKHCVEYRRSGEKRWVNMMRTAFYIVERVQHSAGEVKEMEPDPTEGLAPLEKWTFQEDITREFCVAQSLLHRAYGRKIQETGHKTVGHTCVTDRDKAAARQVKGSLLYGELLPRGVNKAMGSKHLNAAKAETVFDLGMGTGKVAMQVFLQFPNLKRVYGIELSQARYSMGETALFALMDLQPGMYTVKRHIPGQFMSIEMVPESSKHSAGTEDTTVPGTGAHSAGGSDRAAAAQLAREGCERRVLEYACGNLFDVPDIHKADVVLLETDVTSDVHTQLCRFLSGMRRGSQALTYLDLRKIWGVPTFPFRQVDLNRPLSDRFPTSWSVNRGHHFFLWTKNVAPPVSMCRDGLEDGADDAMAAGCESKRDRQGQLSGSVRRGGSLALALKARNDARETAARHLDHRDMAIASDRGVGCKSRRGHSKFPRLPFLSCLGLGRRSQAKEMVAGTDNVQATGITSRGNRMSSSGGHPSLREVFLLEPHVMGTDTWDASDAADMSDEDGDGGPQKSDETRRPIAGPYTHMNGHGASRSKSQEMEQQGSSRGQELTEAAELGAMRSPPVGSSSPTTSSCTAM